MKLRVSFDENLNVRDKEGSTCLQEVNIVVLFTNCEVHTGKYSARSFEVRTERKAKVRIFSRMDRINWSIRALLYCRNQRPKPS